MKFEYNLTTFVIFIFLAILIGFLIGRIVQRIKDSSSLKKERKDAIKRSRAVISGQFSEQLAPYLPDFPCNPGDVRFVGKPVDYVGFVGSADGKEITEVLLIEVKTGNSKLNDREKQIKYAVEHGKVRYVEYRI